MTGILYYSVPVMSTVIVLIGLDYVIDQVQQKERSSKKTRAIINIIGNQKCSLQQNNEKV